MTDPDLLAKKLAVIETCVAELRRLARPELLETDVREERFVEHTLQIAIQAAQDIASHIVSDERLGGGAGVVGIGASCSEVIPKLEGIGTLEAGVSTQQGSASKQWNIEIDEVEALAQESFILIRQFLVVDPQGQHESLEQGQSRGEIER